LQALHSQQDLRSQLYGVDIYGESLERLTSLLEADNVDAQLTCADFFEMPSPDDLLSNMPLFDAVVGNPPFIRYQQHAGDIRRLSLAAALRQGVRLSGLASSWAALLVHAGAFLSPNGRLAMVLPAELLSVGYAEPIRQWLRRRFGSVTLVLFERLQFEDALEDVVLLLAQGSGGCEAFSLYYVAGAEDLGMIDHSGGAVVSPSSEGKWTDFLLSVKQRQLFRRITKRHFVSLSEYGSAELGAVTGANDFFAISEPTRQEFGLSENELKPICPPGTRHLKGVRFTLGDWKGLRDSGQRVWLLHPEGDDPSEQLNTYLARGETLGVPDAYKCQIRVPWWRPPLTSPPDLFFTYMSHQFPRLVTNIARVAHLNSMHGVRLRPTAPKLAKSALPFLGLNSVTMLGGEIFGRSYGGGILKMEPREACLLPMPSADLLTDAWSTLSLEREALERQLRSGRWTNVWARVDEVLLRGVLGLSEDEIVLLQDATRALRGHRLSRGLGHK
jgi:hypothetical protein